MTTQERTKSNDKVKFISKESETGSKSNSLETVTLSQKGSQDFFSEVTSGKVEKECFEHQFQHCGSPSKTADAAELSSGHPKPTFKTSLLSASKSEEKSQCKGIESKIKMFESMCKSACKTKCEHPFHKTKYDSQIKVTCSVKNVSVMKPVISECPRRVSYSFGETRTSCLDDESNENKQRRRGLSVQAGLMNIHTSLCSFVTYPCSAQSVNSTSTEIDSFIKAESSKIQAHEKNKLQEIKCTPPSPVTRQKSSMFEKKVQRHSSPTILISPKKIHKRQVRSNSCKYKEKNLSLPISPSQSTGSHPSCRSLYPPAPYPSPGLRSMSPPSSSSFYSVHSPIDCPSKSLAHNHDSSRLVPPGELPSSGPLRRVFSSHARRRKKSKGISFQLSHFLKEPLRVVHSVPLSFPPG